MRNVLRSFVVFAVLVAMQPGFALAQGASGDLAARVMTAVRAAMKPALPFPDTDEAGELPKDGVFSGPWIVRPLEPGTNVIEILANPLNREHQVRSAKAMRQIEDAVEAAQRKSQAQYERALSDAQRSGKSQDVDGITLGDEGVAGARIDAEGHVTIDVEFNKLAYSYAVSSSLEPAATLDSTVPGAVAVLSVPAHVYRERVKSGDEERFCVAETVVFLGPLSVPTVKRRAGSTFDMAAGEAGPPTTSAVRTMVVRLRGSQALILDIVQKADWAGLQTLIRQ